VATKTLMGAGSRPIASTPPPRIPNIVMKDIVIDNCGGGIKASGDVHIAGEGIEITNTPIGFDLEGSATIDVKGVRFDPGRGRRQSG